MQRSQSTKKHPSPLELVSRIATFHNEQQICQSISIFSDEQSKLEKKLVRKYAILDENGNQLADYAKIHPFSFGAEAKHYTGGNALQLCEVKGVPVAPLICYDLRFPEIFQIVSEQAKVIPVIASWPTARREHWMTLLKARAIENQCFILGVNRSGEGGGLSYIGDSMAVSPTGEVLAHVEGGNGLTIVDIDLSEADAYRNSFPVKADRKPALYHTLWEENIKQK